MKFILFISIFTQSFLINAQKSFLKLGLNYTNTLYEYKASFNDYPGYDISYERGLGNKFSISATYNYLKRGNDPSKSDCAVGIQGRVNEDHVLIAEGRYYTKSNVSGLFVSLGIPLTHSTEREYYYSFNGEGDSIIVNRYNTISSIAGIGVKIPFSSNVGLELHVNVSPRYSFTGEDYGTSGFLKGGFRLYCTFGKSE